ncbi:hypothetical protein N8A25_000503 [Enterococcus faecium]|nr:hypothetical protein [Enterococcus faecium]
MLKLDWGPMLNAYPDSMGGTLSDIVNLLGKELKGLFDSFYILPSLFHSDLDRGFCIIDYDLEESMSTRSDLERIKRLGISLKLDFVLNHQSIQSPEFQDILKNGQHSRYRDYFIDWNKFWNNHGSFGEDGYIVPESKYLEKMFFRKPGLPLLMVDFPDGSSVPYWNTFYQEKTILSDGTVKYSGQIDVNIKSPLVWEAYDRTLQKLTEYGASLIRLDAFAYTSKEIGKRNFLNSPETWEILHDIQKLGKKNGLSFLPEIHAGYEEHIYDELADQQYLSYDFFLPGLLIYAMEKHNPRPLKEWAEEINDKNLKMVNMLGCHDGIPMLDLRGKLPNDEIQELIDLIVSRGGHVKNLHGQKDTYYQVNATYFSALGEEPKKLLFARAVQLFMPEKPQIWYLDLFAGKNDYDAVTKAGSGGHKEINRTNLTKKMINAAFSEEVVTEQIRLLRLRNNHSVFSVDSEFKIKQIGNVVIFLWRREGISLSLEANFDTYEYKIVEGKNE